MQPMDRGPWLQKREKKRIMEGERNPLARERGGATIFLQTPEGGQFFFTFPKGGGLFFLGIFGHIVLLSLGGGRQKKLRCREGGGGREHF